MMKVKEFLEKAKLIADDCSTMYMMGGHGHSLTWNDTFNELIRDYAYNKRHEEELRKQFEGLKQYHPFAFDCCGLVKSIIWGFTGDWSDYAGGTVYQSGGLLDCNQEGLIENYSEDVSSDFSNIEAGEILYMSGHCGIYMGEGKVIECTPKWDSCVQWRNLDDRKWTKHFKFTVVDYTPEAQPNVFLGFNCPHCGKSSVFEVLTNLK